jgi:hypothetical protein
VQPWVKYYTRCLLRTQQNFIPTDSLRYDKYLHCCRGHIVKVRVKLGPLTTIVVAIILVPDQNVRVDLVDSGDMARLAVVELAFEKFYSNDTEDHKDEQ